MFRMKNPTLLHVFTCKNTKLGSWHARDLIESIYCWLCTCPLEHSVKPNVSPANPVATPHPPRVNPRCCGGHNEECEGFSIFESPIARIFFLRLVVVCEHRVVFVFRCTFELIVSWTVIIHGFYWMLQCEQAQRLNCRVNRKQRLLKLQPNQNRKSEWWKQ